MAIATPVLAALIFAITDFSILFWHGAQVQQGVRETARAAAVADWGGDSSCQLVGASPPTEAKELICQAKDHIDLGDADTRIRIRLTGSGDVVGEHVIVCAQYPRESASGFYDSLLSGGELHSRVKMRIEVAGTLTESAETPLASDGWASCRL